jgi:hypothetical protein
MSDEPAPARPGKGPHWVIWLFALVGLLGVVAIIFLAATIFRVEGPRRSAEGAGEPQAVNVAVRDVRRLEGSNLLLITIAAPGGRSSFGSYSGGGDDVRNILLLHPTSGAVLRLLPDNNRRIAGSWFLPAQADFEPRSAMGEAGSDPEQTPPPPPAYFALLVARPDHRDGFDLLIGTLAGGDQGYVMQRLEGVESLWMQSPTRIGLIVNERQNVYFRVVDIPTRRVVQSRRIAI